MKKHSRFFTVIASFFVIAAGAGNQFSAMADDRFATLAVGANTYTNVTITSVTATDIYFTHDAGMGNAKIKDLSPDLKEHFHYNPAKAASIEKKRSQENVQYHIQAVNQPNVKSPDETRLPDSPSAPQSSAQWGTEFSDALNQAQAQHKLLLINFTGSDWSPACTKFDQEVLSTSEFAAYAQSKLILLRVDFPHNIPQSEKVRHANRDLATRFNVADYPTLILVEGSGTELGRQGGDTSGGSKAFIAELDGFSKK